MKKRLVCVGLMCAILLSGCNGASSQTNTEANSAAVEAETQTRDTEQETQVTEEETESVADRVSDDYYVSPKNTGALQVANGKLCDMQGNPVQLKGVSTHGIARIENFLNADMLLQMRNDWGVNVLRLAMYIQSMDGYAHSEYYTEKNTQIMEDAIELATECDMYVLVDWHTLDEKTPMKYVEESKEFFAHITEKYKDYDNLIYEICNEPNETEWSEIKDYANQVIPVIRENDPDSVIICGTPEWSQRVDEALADPLDYDNLMYTLHFYSAAHKDELRDRMLTCIDAGLPIFVTEYGITNSDGKMPRDIEEADKWMQALDDNDISCCIWCLAKTGDACNLLNANTPKFSDITDEDMNDTGLWFVDMMSKYKERITAGK